MQARTQCAQVNRRSVLPFIYAPSGGGARREGRPREYSPLPHCCSSGTYPLIWQREGQCPFVQVTNALHGHAARTIAHVPERVHVANCKCRLRLLPLSPLLVHVGTPPATTAHTGTIPRRCHRRQPEHRCLTDNQSEPAGSPTVSLRRAVRALHALRAKRLAVLAGAAAAAARGRRAHGG